MSIPVTPSLMTQLLDLAGQLDAERVLAELVRAAVEHTGAKYAAIAELDALGETTTFVQQGMEPQIRAQLGHPPRGRGVLGALPTDGVLLMDDLTKHPAFGGFPPGHPPMHTFLGVPVMAGGIMLGRLYLTEKQGGFTPEDVETVKLMAAAAAIAIDNARMYQQAQDREQWMTVSQEITASLLEGEDEDDVLQLVAQRIREVSHADGAVIVLPTPEGEWMMEIVDGEGMHDFIGQIVPEQGPALAAIETAQGLLVDSIAREQSRFVKQAWRFERALYAPLLAKGHDSEDHPSSTIGVLILFRLPGRPAFTPNELEVAGDFGTQAALALRMAAARHAEDMTTLLNERGRIARDLHDLAIQQLFATGMRLERAKSLLGDDPHSAVVTKEIDQAVAEVDEGVLQIRGIVRSLRDRDEGLPVLERLLRETSIARSSLGFAPSILVTLDEEALGSLDTEDDRSDEIDARLGVELGDDLVAVVREGLSNVARHAAATSARVTIDVGLRTVRVAVADDGRGADPSVTRRSGLANLQARAGEHDGAARLVPNPGGGSVLIWEAWIL